MPPASTASIRALQIASLPIRAAVLAKTARPTRVRAVDRQPERDHPAEREAAEVRPLDVEGVQQCQRVQREPLQRVRPRRRVRPAVAAAVVAHDSEPFGERGGLGLPHPEVGAERVDEQHDRRAGRAVDAVVEPDAVVGLDGRHGSLTPQPAARRDYRLDVVRRTIFAGPRPDIISGAERGVSWKAASARSTNRSALPR